MSDDLELKATVSVSRTGDGIESTTRQVEALGKTVEKTGSTAKQASTSIKDVGGEMKQMGKLAHEAENAMAGFERGGIGGTISGLKNLGALLKGVGEYLGAPFVAAIAGATAAWYVFTQKVRENEAEMKSMRAEMSQHSKLYKQLGEQSLREVSAAYDALSKSAAIATAAMAASAASMAKVQAQATALAAAERDLALATAAGRGGDTAGMERKYAEDAQIDAGMNAKLNRNAAHEELNNLGQLSRESTLKVSAAKQRADSLKEMADRIAGTSGDQNSKAAVDARAAASKAQADYRNTYNADIDFQKSLEPQTHSAMGRFDDATAAERLAGVRLQTEKQTTKNTAPERYAARQEQLAGTRDKNMLAAEAARSSGDTMGAVAAAKAAQSAVDEMRNLTKSQKEANTAIANEARAQAHANAVLTEQLRQQKYASLLKGAGGGTK